jgi:hypothetical protein
MSAKPEIVEEAYTILSQLGGRRFLVMTGADKLMAAGRTTSNPNPWLRMDLRDNKAQVNRLKITLMPTDTYKVEFYHQKLVNWEPLGDTGLRYEFANVGQLARDYQRGVFGQTFHNAQVLLLARELASPELPIA